MSDRLDIVLINQFYPPDLAPTGRYLHDLALGLARRGHRVRVICSERGYDGAGPFPRCERLGGVLVWRLPAWRGRRGMSAKILGYAGFHALSFWVLMTMVRRMDLIVSMTTPPWIGLLARLAGLKHGAIRMNWIMDLYPDALSAHRRGGIGADRLARALTRRELAGSRLVAAPSAEMAARTDRYRARRAPRVLDVPLWTDQALAPWPQGAANPARERYGWTAEDLVLMYSGNMGAGHRLGDFLRAARREAEAGRQPVWAFAGDGHRRHEIVEFAAANPEVRIQLLPYADRRDLAGHLAAADVHLASLEPAWRGVMIPSKIQGIFAMERPVIYVGAPDDEVSGWIRESGAGWLVAPEDIDGLCGAIDEARDPRERLRRGQAAAEFARRTFSMTNGCSKLIERIESLRRSQRQDRNPHATR